MKNKNIYNSKNGFKLIFILLTTLLLILFVVSNIFTNISKVPASADGMVISSPIYAEQPIAPTLVEFESVSQKVTYAFGLDNKVSTENYYIFTKLVDNENINFRVAEMDYSSANVAKLNQYFKFMRNVYDKKTLVDDEGTSYEDVVEDESKKINEFPDWTMQSSGESYILSSTVVGERWDGTTFNGSLDEIDAAGTYVINSITVKLNEDNYTNVVTSCNLMIVFKAQIKINQAALDSLFNGNNQFNLDYSDRSYGNFDNMRQLLNFCNNTGSVQNDKFYFKNNGIDLIQFYNFGNASHTPSINVIGDLNDVFARMSLDWYLDDLLIDSSTAITDADDYVIKISNGDNFEYFSEYTAEVDEITGKEYLLNALDNVVKLDEVIEMVVGDGNSEFEKPITIEKRKLNLAENAGVSIVREREFNRNAEAYMLFDTDMKDISLDDWINKYNGISSDYSNLYTYFQDEELNIFDFSKSYFTDTYAGEYDGSKSVKMGISINDRVSPDLTYWSTIKNYTVVMGYWNNETYNQFPIESIISGTNCFDLATVKDGDTTLFDGKFTITPNNLSMAYGVETRYSYGTYFNNSDFNFSSMVSVKGEIQTLNWKTTIMKGILDVSNLARDTANNTVYIGIMTCKKNNDAAIGDVAYTDGQNDNYTLYDGRLYAGDYYFYYNVAVVHKESSVLYDGKVTPSQGVFLIPDKNGNIVAKMNLGNLQKLIIENLKLAVKVNSMDVDKEYDGTAELTSFNAVLTGDSIKSGDEGYIQTIFNANYADKNAKVGLTIYPDFRIEYTTLGQGQIDFAIQNGTPIENTTAYKVRNSYALNTDSVSGFINKGSITKLDININIIEETTNGGYPYYSKVYGENNFVVIRVIKKNELLPDSTVALQDYYYYFQSYVNNGIVPASELPSKLSIPNLDHCIKFELSGFLLGEGFKWTYNYQSSNLEDFMANTKTDFNSFFTWKDGDIDIEQYTDSCVDENSYYTLSINNASVLNELLINYNIINVGKEKAYLFIDKLDLKEGFVVIQDDPNNLYREYSNEFQIEDMVTNGGSSKAVFNISGHEESDYIVSQLEFEAQTLTSLITVTTFNNATFDASNDDISKMKLAGIYHMRFNLPASKNYKGATFEGNVTISGKKVTSYITFAVRQYLEENPIFNDSCDLFKYPRSQNERLMYSYYVKIDQITQTSYSIYAYPCEVDGIIKYKLVEDDSIADVNYLQQVATLQYIVFDESDPETDLNKKSMINTIIFDGFLSDHTLTTNNIMPTITISKNSTCDAQANGYQGGITAVGASAPNYNFIDGTGSLFVLKKALLINLLDNNQTGVYAGKMLVPNYLLLDDDSADLTLEQKTEMDSRLKSAGIAGLAITVLQYWNENNIEVTQNKPEDLTDVGKYIIELKVKVLKQGNNYAPSKTVVNMTYTITPMQIVFIETERNKEILYNSFDYEIGEFSQYFTGNNSNWGTVDISSIINSDNITVDVINSADIYSLTIKGTIKSENRKNIYFEKDGDTYLYEKEETIIITVAASANYDVAISTRIGNIGDESFSGISFANEAGFKYIYNSLTYLPSISYTGLIGNVVLDNSYEIFDESMTASGQIIKNAATYYIVYTVNAKDSPNYNKNYFSYENAQAKIFKIIVGKAPLLVKIAFDEGYSAKKTYLDENSVIGDHMFLAYSGWAYGENENTSLNMILPEYAPVIDWGSVTKNTFIGTYSIRPISVGNTRDLSNYYFVYDGSDILFTIYKADPKLIVYGEWDNNEEPIEDVYYNYYIYKGKTLKPLIKRRYNDMYINDLLEIQGDGNNEIRCVGLFTGNKDVDIDADNKLIDQSKIDTSVTDCLNVGAYIFEITVGASNNYNAIEATNYYLEVRKASLSVTIKGNIDESANDRGYAQKIYDKVESYPVMKVSYSGFVGIDTEEMYNYNNFNMYSYQDRNKTTMVSTLNLKNPIYKILDGESVISPINVGVYNVNVYVDDDYGISDNYYLEIAYYKEVETIFYPQIEIIKRKVDIVATNERITKMYDSTTKVIGGSVKPVNYRFSTVQDDDDSGLIYGDIILLNLDYDLSCFDRANVLDSNGIESIANVHIFGYYIDNANYELVVSNKYNDGNGDYIILLGAITRAEAKVTFVNEQGNTIVLETNTVYNGEMHPITITVKGVKLPDNSDQILLLNIGYERKYTSSNYSSVNPPKEAGIYNVIVTIIDTNYSRKTPYIKLIIEKAPVQITFNGDAVALYGDRSMGLTAYATGVKDYYQNIIVTYYDKNNKYISNIKKANVGVYTAKAVHVESTNFKYQEGTTEFTIRYRSVNVVSKLLDSYFYTGSYIYPLYSFVFDGVTYYPTLEFDIYNGDNVVSLNYGNSAESNSLPKNVGKYRVGPARYYGNFEIINNEKNDFTIKPINLLIKLNDGKINLGKDISYSYELVGNVNNETINNLDKKPDIVFYDNVTNEKLASVPTKAGIYKMIPSGAESKNYNIQYSFGILNINKPVLSFTDNGSTSSSYELEGSFSSGTEVVVREIANSEFSSYKTMYDSYCIENDSFGGTDINNVIYINFDDGSVSLSEGDKITIKMSLVDVLGDKASNAKEGDIYQVAHFTSNGTVEKIEARVEGNYLVFQSSSLEAFSVITDASNDVSSDKMWILYVAIGISLLLIGLTILLIKKRA